MRLMIALAMLSLLGTRAFAGTTAVCGVVIVTESDHAFKLNSVNDNRVWLPDGVYHTEKSCYSNGLCRNWCLYKIIEGVPNEIESY